MYSLKKLLSVIAILVMVSGMLIPVATTYAAPLDDVLGTLSSSTISSPDGTSGGGIFNKFFSLLFNKILGPLFDIISGGKASSPVDSPVKVTPLPPSSAKPGSIQDSGVLRGKVIVVDPGHGGSNPGAVANGSREADNNLSVGLKLRDELVKAGANVIMTRESNQTVAPEGSTLGEELQARVEIAESNHADLFVSVHSNSNPDSSIAGTMTFYPEGRSSQLALDVQSSLIEETQAVDKGVSPATFYVLRNTSMPSILVEMGFVTNEQEAARLQNDSYRNSIAQGIFKGIVRYFNAK